MIEMAVLTNRFN